jgi:hypothetical protein
MKKRENQTGQRISSALTGRTEIGRGAGRQLKSTQRRIEPRGKIFDWELILSTGENSIDGESILSGGKGNPLAALWRSKQRARAQETE